jgi:RNA polymerase sigma factor (TIGR02999 family)
MDDVTRILAAIERREPDAAGKLLPLVYDELRRLAAARLAREGEGHSLQATALVHEAYIRLVGSHPEKPFDGRGHFFAAAAEAMRRILIDRARDRRRLKRGGGRRRVRIDLDALFVEPPGEDLLALDEALTALAQEDPGAAELVKLRAFAGADACPGRRGAAHRPPDRGSRMGLRPRLALPRPRRTREPRRSEKKFGRCWRTRGANGALIGRHRY